MPRPAGSKNRVGAAVKDNILRVFEDIGGREHMATWARKNPDRFLEAYMRLAPKEIVADVTGDLNIQLISHLDHDTPAEPEA